MNVFRAKDVQQYYCSRGNHFFDTAVSKDFLPKKQRCLVHESLSQLVPNYSVVLSPRLSGRARQEIIKNAKDGGKARVSFTKK